MQSAIANYARYCSKEGDAVYDKNPADAWAGQLDDQSQTQIQSQDSASTTSIMVPSRPTIRSKKKTNSTDIIKERIVWTIFLFQTQMAQDLQPCSTVLYGCF